MRHIFRALIEEIEATLRFEMFVENDTASIVVDNYLVMVAYLPQAEKVLLSTAVAELPVQGKAEIFRAVLQGQYFFEHTQGATLSIDPEAHFLALQRVDALQGLDVVTYPRILERFMQVADYWRAECQRLGTNAESDRGEAVSTANYVDGQMLLRV